MPSIFDSVFGQGEVPSFSNPPPGFYLNQTRKNVPALADINVDFNKRIAEPYAKIQSGVENIYDPYQRSVREATSKRILEDVQHPYDLPPELAALFRQSANQTRGATGLGASEAGRFSMLKSLGLNTLGFGENRINRAASFTRSAPTPNQLFQPITDMTPSDALNLSVAGVNNENQFNQYKTDVGNQNTRNLLGVPLDRLLAMGGVAAGAYGAVNDDDSDNPYRNLIA